LIDVRIQAGAGQDYQRESVQFGRQAHFQIQEQQVRERMLASVRKRRFAAQVVHRLLAVLDFDDVVVQPSFIKGEPHYKPVIGIIFGD
jgi:hypothetical protein